VTVEPRASAKAQVKVINPLEYLGWDDLIPNRLPGGFFYSTAWARVLCDTYKHVPLYFCRFSGNQLTEALPVMEVSSRLTGKRGVSLPFTDSCGWLGTGGEADAGTFEAALEVGASRGWRYLECRGNRPNLQKDSASLVFLSHSIDLTTGSAALLERFDPSVRRAIRKAEKSSVVVTFDSDEESMRRYYALHERTRQRHGVPPQPINFFRNIASLVFRLGKGFIATAWQHKTPIAGAVFFQHGGDAVYKFGASDSAFQHLRPNNLLFSEVIKRLTANGISSLQLGRTSPQNEGLRRFKLGFGAQEDELPYFRYDFSKQAFVAALDRAESGLKRLFCHFPRPLLRFTGRILYPHLS